MPHAAPRWSATSVPGRKITALQGFVGRRAPERDAKRYTPCLATVAKRYSVLDLQGRDRVPILSQQA
jgi:hypothetical protein